MVKILPALLAIALLAPAALAQPVATPQPTRVLDRAAAQRLVANKGLTLQWIDWNTRGHVRIWRDGRVWRLRGAQAEAGGPGRLLLDGTISEIGRTYFTFQGKIRITDAPDRGRNCESTKSWHFAITQRRKYYRLREFEWCDYLTDYIDIHF